MLKNASSLVLIALLAIGCSKKDNVGPSSGTKSSERITVSSFSSPKEISGNDFKELDGMTKEEWEKWEEKCVAEREVYNKLSDDDKITYWIKGGEKALANDHKDLDMLKVPVINDYTISGFPFRIYKLSTTDNLYAAIFTGITDNETGKIPTYSFTFHRATKEELNAPLHSHGFSDYEIESYFTQLDAMDAFVNH